MFKCLCIHRHFFEAEYPEPTFKVPLLIPMVYTLFLVTVFITPFIKVYYHSYIHFIQNKLIFCVGPRSQSLNTTSINNMFWFYLCFSQEN